MNILKMKIKHRLSSLYYRLLNIYLYFQYLLDPRDSKHLKPSFLVIGVQKGGTNALFHYLSQHPNIKPAKIKEPCFFNKYYHKGVRWYHQFFPLLNSKNPNLITFEASVGYICDKLFAKRIYNYNPNMKLILIIRDPIERVFSQWNMCRKFAKDGPYPELAEDRDFHEVINYEIDLINKGVKSSQPPLSYIQRGLYLEQIENYLKYFPRRQIFITENKKLKKRRVEVLNEIINFLELPMFAWDKKNLENQREGDYEGKKMDDETIKILSAFYRPYNKKIFDFLGEQYDWK
jgi:hypothetical protein